MKPHGRIRGAMLGPIHSANRPDPPAHHVSFYLFNLLSKEACVRRNIDRPRCHTKTAEEISLNEAARLPMIAQRGSHRMFGLGRQFAT